MGYTHYWHRYAEFSEAEWDSILSNSKRFLETLPDADGFIYDYDEPTRPAEFGQNQIHFTFKYIWPGNGEFEPLRLSRAITDVWDEWGCCKTWGRNPYDYAVTGVLSLAEHFAPKAISVRSDGIPEYWQPALELVRAATGLPVQLPSMIPPIMKAEQEKAEDERSLDRLRRITEDYLARHPEIKPCTQAQIDSVKKLADRLQDRSTPKAKVRSAIVASGEK